ncbi:O-antigen ligase family protein [Vibrio sp. OCN044]|uniref:O-antigen ligase family protein n=1 Tax=Vibrio tetraodonis subsp. pristinus TaxID=2695891 RepID=A0A6L8LXC5_9VIBR|nr:O-antigen ligase family protein [Vibrio tetraodonis]MYM60774.1 O-antigen ligase family protein [Vibrio tetraodonis subsp. pristinus]
MNLQNFKVSNEKIAALSAFLVLSLLLITKNFSVAIVCLLLLVSIYSIIKERNNIKWDKQDTLVVICLSAYLLSNAPLFVIDDWNFRYFKGASRIILCIPIYIFLKHCISIKKIYASPVIWGATVGSLGAFLIASYQFFIEEVGRAGGFLFSINFGYLASLLAVLCIALLKLKRHRWLLILSIILASSATLMTLTRGAIIVIPIALLLYFIFEYKALGLRKITIIVVTCLSALTLIYHSSTTFQNRISFTIKEAHNILTGHVSSAVSSGGRLMLWKASVEAIKVSPITGLTYSERESLNKDLYKKGIVNSWTTTVQRGHAHSQYFEQLASGGILGVIALACMLLIPLIYFFRHRNRSNAAYVGVFFVLAVSICCLTEAPLQQNLISTFYGFMLALFFAVTQQEIKNHKEVDNGQIRSQG